MGSADVPGLDDGATPVEPTPEQRAFARSLFGTYTALRDVGFSDADALGIVTSMTGGVSAALGDGDRHS